MTDRKRTTAIQVRVTEQEKRTLERQARRCGLSLSGYLRQVGVGGGFCFYLCEAKKRSIAWVIAAVCAL